MFTKLRKAALSAMETYVAESKEQDYEKAKQRVIDEYERAQRSEKEEEFKKAVIAEYLASK